MPTAADRKCVAKAACRRPYFKTSHSLERCDKIREKREERRENKAKRKDKKNDDKREEKGKAGKIKK